MEKNNEMMEKYIKYLTNCLFSNRDFFTEEKILTFNEFKERTLQGLSNAVK